VPIRTEADVKGRPISGVLETASSCTLIGPATNAARPALMALAKALAIRTGSIARETAVFMRTASKPHSWLGQVVLIQNLQVRSS
jgi:hypothetical protein